MFSCKPDINVVLNLICILLIVVAPLNVTAQIFDTIYSNPNPCDAERIGSFKKFDNWIYFTHSSGTAGNPNERELTLDLSNFQLNRLGNVFGIQCDKYKRYINDSVFVQGCDDPSWGHYLKLNNSINGTSILSFGHCCPNDLNTSQILEYQGLPLLIGLRYSDLTYTFCTLDSSLTVIDSINEFVPDYKGTLGERFYQAGYGKPLYFMSLDQDSIRLRVYPLDTNLNTIDTFNLAIEGLPIPNISTFKGGTPNWIVTAHDNYFLLKCYTDGYYNIVRLTKSLKFDGWMINIPYAGDSCYFINKYPNSNYFVDRFGSFRDAQENWIFYSRGSYALNNDTEVLYQTNKILKYNPEGNLVWETCVDPKPHHDPNYIGCFSSNFSIYYGSVLTYATALTDTSYLFIGSQVYGDNNDYSDIRVLVLDSAGNYQNSLEQPEIESVSEIIIYPNPVKDHFKAKFNTVQQVTDVVVYNSLGKVVETFHVSQITDFEINCSNWESGVYYLTASKEGTTLCSKRLIKH